MSQVNASAQKALEEGLRAAFRTSTASLSSLAGTQAAMAHWVRATADLPLPQVATWDHVIRSEIRHAERVAETAATPGWRQLLRLPRPDPVRQAMQACPWLGLSHPDGHVRESTLRSLTGAAPNAFFLALVAVRLNDWIPQVREAACETLQAIARAGEPEHGVEMLLALLPAWQTWGRVEAAGRQALLSLFALDHVTASLQRRIMQSTSGPGAHILSQALRAPAMDGALAEIAARAVQPAVRARAYRALLAGKATWVEGRHWQWTDQRYCLGRMVTDFGERPLQAASLIDTLTHAAADRSPRVRRVAAEALIREAGSLGEAARPLARHLAADTARPVSSRGEFALQSMGPPADPGPLDAAA